MMETNSGVWLDRTLRTTACGTWWSASAAGGHPLALLQLEPALVAQPAARERLAAAVAAVRGVNLSGVLRTTELVVDARRSWLVVAALPTPTLADLLAALQPLALGAAAGIAVDVAQALRGLHAAGLSHGDLAADNVILTSAGSATLVEVGVLAAVHDEPTDIGRDVVAWAALVRDLAAGTTAPEVDLLVLAAATAESGDLATAAGRLATQASDLPDFAGRESLAAILPVIGPAPTRLPVQRSTMDSAASAVRVRFGRGVPHATIAVARSSTAAPPPARRGSSRGKSSRGLQVAVVALLLLLGAGAALWWLLLLG